MFDIKMVNKGKPEVVVITPLLPEDKVSRETKITIKRNDIPFLWVKSIGKNNIPKNVSLGLNHVRNINKDIKYILPLDNDIVMGRGMIDKLHETLKSSTIDVGYAYASFQFKGVVNKAFPATPFNINKLAVSNYISSNSMMKISAIDHIGGIITDNKYKRLLDWCMWLKMYNMGLIGIPCPEANFIAISTKKDISAGSDEEYKRKASLVYKDFIEPIVKKQEVKNKEEEEKTKKVEPYEVLEVDF